MKLLKLLSALVMVFMLATVWGCSGGVESGLNASKGSKISAKLAGSEIQVSGATDDQQNPQVVYLADKKVYFVVWEDWRDRDLATTDFPADPARFAGADIWGKFLNADGMSCGGDFVITNRLSGNQTLPSVAYRPGDKLLVAWQDSVGSATSGYIRYSSITSIPSPVSCAAVVPTVSAPVQVSYNHFMQYSNTIISNNSSFTIVGDPTGGADVTGGAVLTPYVFPRSIIITGTYPAEDGVLATSGTPTPIYIQDDGMGKLMGSGISAGTINYMTGKLDVTLINEV